jgi:hypothetical protein
MDWSEVRTLDQLRKLHASLLTGWWVNHYRRFLDGTQSFVGRTTVKVCTPN